MRSGEIFEQTWSWHRATSRPSTTSVADANLRDKKQKASVGRLQSTHGSCLSWNRSSSILVFINWRCVWPHRCSLHDEGDLSTADSDLLRQPMRSLRRRLPRGHNTSSPWPGQGPTRGWKRGAPYRNCINATSKNKLIASKQDNKQKFILLLFFFNYTAYNLFLHLQIHVYL